MKSRYNVSWLLGTMSMLSLIFFTSSDLTGQTATGACTGISGENNFKIVITGMTGTVNNVYIDSIIQPDSLISAGTFTSNDIAFVDGTASYDVRLISITGATSDTMDYVVHEVLCTDINDDGIYDFNAAGCDYTLPIGSGGAIVSTVAPYNSDNVYLYVLTDSSGAYTSAPTTNYTGYFTGLDDGEYRVSAYHFLSEADAVGFVTSLGTSGDIDSFSSMSEPVCYNFCGGANYTVDCQCIVSIDQHPVNDTICEAGDAFFYVSTSITPPIPNGGVLEYQWQESTDNGTTFADLSGATDSTLTLSNVALADDGNAYRVLVTLDVGGTNICQDTSSAGILTIDSLPILSNTLDAIVCSDDVSGIILSVSAGSVSAASYNIVMIDSAGLVPSAGGPSTGSTTDVNEIADDAWTNTTGSDVVVTYSIAPTSGAGCIGDTVDVMLTIMSAPSYAGPSVTTVCSDDIAGINIPATDDNGMTMDSFIVAASVGGNLTGTATTGNTTDVTFIASDTYNNISGAIDSVVYTITPFSSGCVGVDFEVIVRVKPEPIFAAAVNETVCSDEPIGIDIPFVDDAGLNLDSVSITAVVGTSLSGVASTGDGITNIGYIANDTFTNTTTLVDSVIYTVTPYSMGCVGSTFDIVAVIVPEPVGSDPDTIICSDEAISITLLDLITNGVSVDSFTWIATDNPDVTGESLTLQSSNTLSETLTNISGSDQIVEYTVTPLSTTGSGGCNGDPFTVSITVRSEPTADNETASVCSDEALDIVLTDNINNSVAIQGFIYTVGTSDGSVPAGSARTDTTTSNITDSYTNTTGSDVTITYTVTPISVAGCPGDDFTVVVTVHPEPVLDSTLNTTVCSQSPIGVTLGVEVGSVAADSFRIVSINVASGLTADGGNVSTGTYGSSGAISGDIYTNVTSDSLDVTYVILPISAEGCEGDQVSVVVTIEPEPVVDAGTDDVICSNGTVDLTATGINPSITGGASAGIWSTSGDGSFDNTTFGTGVSYTPGTNDIAAGTVTLTLTSTDAIGTCSDDSDSVLITINDVTCSQFPWNGN